MFLCLKKPATYVLVVLKIPLKKHKKPAIAASTREGAI